MAAPELTRQLQVTVCYAEPGRAWSWAVSVPGGASVADAIAASGYSTHFPDRDPYAHGVGVFGVQRAASDLLEDGDRVEIYRPLVFDPKESRRRRAAHRAKKSTPTQRRV